MGHRLIVLSLILTLAVYASLALILTTAANDRLAQTAPSLGQSSGDVQVLAVKSVAFDWPVAN